MFDLEAEIANWRARMRRFGSLDDIEIAELEDHLRSTLEDLDLNNSLEDSFAMSIARLGDERRLHDEFCREKGSMTSMAKIVGSTISLGLVALVLSIGGGLGPFINVPSLVFVAGIVGGGLWAGFGPRMIVEAFGASLGARTIEPAKQQRYVDVFRRGYRLSWSAGVVGVLIGVIQMLSSLDDFSRLGQGLAVCLLTVFYGALLAELGFSNLQQWLMNRAPVVELTA